MAIEGLTRCSIHQITYLVGSFCPACKNDSKTCGLQKLSNEEKRLLAVTAKVWNTWCELPDRRDDDNAEFCSALHALQHLIALRVARRVDPDVWS